MIKNNNPYLIEYNVRMGDPECQTILPLLKNDFIEVIENCLNSTLDKIDLKWSKKKSISIVLTSIGYPDAYDKNVLIEGLERIEKRNNQFIFHAGTKLINGKFFSNGGRVLNFVSMEDTFKAARESSLKSIKSLNWKNGYFRKDIGHKVIDD